MCCVLGNDDLLNSFPDIDILVNTCRTKGVTRRHLETNYNRASGWIVHNVFVEKYYPSNPILENQRDILIMDEIVSLITGLPKI